MDLLEEATGSVLLEKVFLEISQNSQENIFARVFFNFIKKETLAQVFSCEFCEISTSTFLTEQLWVTASDLSTYIKELVEERLILCAILSLEGTAKQRLTFFVDVILGFYCGCYTSPCCEEGPFYFLQWNYFAARASKTPTIETQDNVWMHGRYIRVSNTRVVKTIFPSSISFHPNLLNINYMYTSWAEKIIRIDFILLLNP